MAFIHLHLDIEDTSLLLDLLLDSSHGLIEDRQALCALQSGRCHHVTRGSNQVDLPGTRPRQCFSNTQPINVFS